MNDFLTCNEVKELLSPYFDNELSKNECIKVEKHLKRCAECRQEFENIKKLSCSIKNSFGKNSSSDYFYDQEGLLPEDLEKCMSVRFNLSAFIDGETPKQKTIEILEHIINCEFCRKQYEKVKKTSKITRHYLETSSISEVYSKKEKTYIKVIEKLTQLNNRKKILSSAAAVVFIAVLGWFSIIQFSSVQPEEININKTRYIRLERPLYVKSEQFILTELDSTPSKEVVSLLHGN